MFGLFHSARRLRGARERGYAQSMPVVSAHDVAAELRKRVPGLGVKQLHKLLYYCQGHHLAAFGVPLFTETISAYDMGPVVGELWWQEKQNGPAPVARDDLPESSLNTLGYVVSRYGALTGKDLENLTHNERPWQIADQLRKQRRERRAAITTESMLDYFRNEPSDDADNELEPDSAEVAALLKGAADRLTPEPQDDSLEDLRARLGAFA